MNYFESINMMEIYYMLEFLVKECLSKNHSMSEELSNKVLKDIKNGLIDV